MHQCRLIPIHRAPVNLGISIRLDDGEENRVPLAVIDDYLRWRSAALRSRAERFECIDLTEVKDLCARSPGVEKYTPAEERRSRKGAQERLELHGFCTVNRVCRVV